MGRLTERIRNTVVNCGFCGDEILVSQVPEHDRLRRESGTCGSDWHQTFPDPSLVSTLPASSDAISKGRVDSFAGVGRHLADGVPPTPAGYRQVLDLVNREPLERRVSRRFQEVTA